MAEPGATPSHQFFAGFNAFFSPTWKKTRVEQVSLEVFHLWCILGHPNAKNVWKDGTECGVIDLTSLA